MTGDSRLIRRIQRKNDKKAADQLFDRYYKEIYGYIYRQCGDKECAMNLTQEVFIAAFLGSPRFDEKTAGFRTWLIPFFI